MARAVLPLPALLALVLLASVALTSDGSLSGSQARVLQRVTSKNGVVATASSGAEAAAAAVSSLLDAASRTGQEPLPADTRDKEVNGTQSSEPTEVRPHITVLANSNSVNKKEILSDEQSDPDALADQTEHFEFLMHQQKMLNDEDRDKRMDEDMRQHDELRSQLDAMRTLVQRQEMEIANEKEVIQENAREAQIRREEMKEDQREAKHRGSLEWAHEKQQVEGQAKQTLAMSHHQRHEELTNSLQHKYAAQADTMQRRSLEHQMADVAHQKQMDNLQAMHDAQVRWRKRHEAHPLHLAQQHEKDAWHVTEHMHVVQRPQWQWANMASPTIPTPRVTMAITPAPVVPPLHGADSTLSEPGVHTPLSGMYTSDVWEHEYEQNFKPNTNTGNYYRNELDRQQNGGAVRGQWWAVHDRHVANMEARDATEQQLKTEHHSDQVAEDHFWDANMQDKKEHKARYDLLPAKMALLLAAKAAEELKVKAHESGLASAGPTAAMAIGKVKVMLA